MPRGQDRVVIYKGRYMIRAGLQNGDFYEVIIPKLRIRKTKGFGQKNEDFDHGQHGKTRKDNERDLFIFRVVLCFP